MIIRSFGRVSEFMCRLFTLTLVVAVLTACAGGELASVKLERLKQDQAYRHGKAKAEVEQLADEREALQRDLERDNDRILDQQSELESLSRTAIQADEEASAALARATSAKEENERVLEELNSIQQEMLSIQAKQKMNLVAGADASGSSDAALAQELASLKRKEELLKGQLQKLTSGQ